MLLSHYTKSQSTQEESLADVYNKSLPWSNGKAVLFGVFGSFHHVGIRVFELTNVYILVNMYLANIKK